MKKIFVLGAAIFMMLLTAFVANAQEQEILRLKDGTEITGIVEELSDGSVRITDNNGDIFIFSKDEISSVITEKQKSKELKRSQSGYSGFVEAALGTSMEVGVGGVYFTAGMINAYRFNPYFYLGVGLDIGVADCEHWTQYSYSAFDPAFVLPVYVHMRYSILGGHSGKVSPFVALNVGYEIMHNSVIIEPSAGIQIKKLSIGDLWAGIDFPLHILGDGTLNVALKVGWSF